VTLDAAFRLGGSIRSQLVTLDVALHSHDFSLRGDLPSDFYLIIPISYCLLQISYHSLSSFQAKK
jgi:hypothetical protein